MKEEKVLPGKNPARMRWPPGKTKPTLTAVLEAHYTMITSSVKNFKSELFFAFSFLLK